MIHDDTYVDGDDAYCDGDKAYGDDGDNAYGDDNDNDNIVYDSCNIQQFTHASTTPSIILILYSCYSNYHSINHSIQ